MPVEKVPQAVVDRYKKVAIPTVEDCLRGRGYTNIFMRGVLPLTPGKRLAGRAHTLRYVPSRPDFLKTIAPGEKAPPYQAMGPMGPGDVLVIDALGRGDVGVVGDMMLIQMWVQKGEGVVTDGAIRDIATVATYGISVFAGGRSHKGGTPHIVPCDCGLPVQCGGVLVRPGDVIAGDDDGVLVVPAELAPQVIDEAEEREKLEEFAKELILKEKCPPGRYYPISEQVVKLYREHKGKAT